MKIGWIGIGKMGSRMSKRLIDAGYNVYLNDICKENTETLTKQGALFCDTPAKVAREADIVFITVTDGKTLKSVVAGEAGICKPKKKGIIVVDMSTVDADSSAKVNKEIEEIDGKFLRCPITGSTAFAENGTLGIMASGDKDVFKKVLPLLKILGNRHYYLGKEEQARYAKIAINMMLGATMQIYSEALLIGESVGINWNTLIDVILDSAAASPVIKYKDQMFKNREFTAMFTVANMEKDMDIALAVAKEKGLNLPAGEIARQKYAELHQRYNGDLDFGAILLVNEDLNHLGGKHDGSNDECAGIACAE